MIGGKLLKYALGLFGVGLTAYTIKYVANEYNSVVDNYNNMVDKYNKNIDFINSCDFYEVKKDAPKDIKDAIKNNRFVEVKESIDSGGVKHKETFDPISGFSIHEVSGNNMEDSGTEKENICSAKDFKII